MLIGIGAHKTPWIKFALCALLLSPLAYLIGAALTDSLGANPAETLIRSTGDWALRTLCLTLTITPARVLLGMPTLARYRRLTGLIAYTYAVFHLLCYVWFDMGFSLNEVVTDIIKRPFILVGFLAWLLLSTLAATSADRVIRRLGARNWKRLHRGVYVASALVILHFFWMRAGKQDFAEVLVYGCGMGLLLAWRAYHALGLLRDKQKR